MLKVLAEEVFVPGRYSASTTGSRRIEEAAAALERASSDERPMFPRDLMSIDGVWDLRYSNNVPPPPPPFFPSGSSSGLAGENVTQTIDVMGRRVVNSVTIAPWPRDAGGLPGLGALTSLPLVGGPLAALAGASVRLDLDHSFTVEGDGSNGGARTAAGTNRIGIVFERLERTLSGLDEDAAPELFARLLPKRSEYAVPEPLRAINAALATTPLGGGLFDTTFCDDSLRISRGASPLNRELRVFVRRDPADADADDDAVPREDDFIAQVNKRVDARYAAMFEPDADDCIPSD